MDGAGLAGALAASRARKPGSPALLRRLPRRTVLTVAVVVVVGVSLLAAAVDHALPMNSGGSSSAPTSYYGTLGAALGTARTSYWSWPTSSGPALVFAEGLDSPTLLGPPVNVSHLGVAACAPTLISTGSAPLPPYAGNTTTGVAPEWLYAFQATGNTLIVVAVVNGSSSVVATTPLTGACYSGPGADTTVVPVDSSVAARAAGETPASARYFASAKANNSTVGAEFFLAPIGYLPMGPAGEPVWIVTDTTCQLYGAGSSAGAKLTSIVNAGTGTLYSQSASSVTC